MLKEEMLPPLCQLSNASMRSHQHLRKLGLLNDFRKINYRIFIILVFDEQNLIIVSENVLCVCTINISLPNLSLILCI